MTTKNLLVWCSGTCALVLLVACSDKPAPKEPAPAALTATSKPATPATIAANKALADDLNFSDKQDFEDAQRGLIEAPETLTIKNDKRDVVWDLESYKKYIGLDKAAPDSVNPSLWRNAQLNMIYGLFKVTDRIYQVRGYDLSNVTFIQGNTGWIVGDPLISAETAKAAYELVTNNLGKKPVVAVIYSHSHVDHYGGVRGLVDEADVKSGKVKIIAPENFTEESVAENVIAGNAMGRRAVYMYGAVLPLLLADAYEQMGYQAESGPWRSIYLQGASELRNGVPAGGGTVTASPDTIRAMSPELLFDYLGVRLNGEKAAGKKLTLNVNFTDLKKPYALTVENGVLNYTGKTVASADATMTLTKATLDRIQVGQTTLDKAIAAGEVKIDGRKEAFDEFFGMLDNFNFWFNIVTP